MRKFWLLIPCFLAVPLAEAASVADANFARLLSFAELEKRLGTDDLRILDVRPKSDYDKGHIPGAVWVDAKVVEAMAAKPGALTDREVWEKWIAPLGLGPETDVVIYDAKRQLDAARLWWLLGYIGVERATLLDGNFPLWASERRPVSTEVLAVARVAFKVMLRPDRHATREEVLTAIGGNAAVIIDARSVDEFAGKDRRSKRAGHIPAACSLEWSNLVDKDGRFLDPTALRAKLSKAGVKPDDAVITHCQGGGRASVNAFVLERLGFKTRNYYLGWSDWGNAEETPVENNPAAESDR